MKIYYILVGLVVFLLCAGIATAVDTPYAITLTSSKDWVVANNSDTAIITAHVTNQTGSNVAGVQVEFRALNATLGSVVPSSSTTGPDGKASTTFKSQFFNGHAHIFAFLASNPTINTTLIQKIDHGPPKYMTVGYQDQVHVGTNTTIFIRLFDKNWNPVDTLRDKSTGPSEIPQVRFVLDSSPGTNATFNGNWNSQFYSGTTIYSSPSSGLYVNETGIIAVDLKVSNLAGDNVITIDPLTAEPAARVIVIKGSSSNSTPANIEMMVNPTTLYQMADGKSNFTITYWLSDDIGNPLNGKIIDVNVSTIDPETNEIIATYGQYSVTTMIDGSGTMIIGPTSTPQFLRIVASSPDKRNVTSSRSIEFYQPGAAYLGLTVMPDIMPSLDVTTNITPTVIAKVTDRKSNPYQGATVTFTLTNKNYPPAQIQIANPFLGNMPGQESVSLITDVTGKAITTFTPGKFDVSDLPSDQKLVFGNATILAQVTELTDDIHNVSWKNYPFISVRTAVSSSEININDTIDVTIQVRGEGLAISFREPMDVVLATSRANSMLEENPDRMTYAFTAEDLFIDKIEAAGKPYAGTDHIGLLTFGGDPNSASGVPLPPTKGDYKNGAGVDNDDRDDVGYIDIHYPGHTTSTYFDQVKWEHLPDDDLDTLRSKIHLTVPFGGTDNKNEMPFRLALYESIVQLMSTPNKNKAIVALVDQQITDYGNILATGNAVTTVAQALQITEGNRYYAFKGPDRSWGVDDPRQNMATFAEQNGIKIYVIYAATKTNTNDENELKTLAEQTGGAYNYTGGVASNLPGVYDWIAGELIRKAATNTSMTINMSTIRVNQVEINQRENIVFNYVYEEGNSTREMLLLDQDPEPIIIHDFGTRNQSKDYYDDFILNFTVGTIELNQIWQAKYKLRSNMTGSAEIFGDGSVITFENFGEDITYIIPESFIQITEVQEEPLPETYDLTIDEFNVANESGGVPISWTLSYTKPDANPNEVHARIVYLDSSGNMHTFGGVRPGLTGNVYIPKSLLPPDGYALKFMIVADAPLAPQRQKIQEFPGTGYTPTGLGGIGPGGLGGGTGENPNGGILILK